MPLRKEKLPDHCPFDSREQVLEMYTAIEKIKTHQDGQALVAEHLHKALDTHQKDIKILLKGQAQTHSRVEGIENVLNNGITDKLNTAVEYIRRNKLKRNRWWEFIKIVITAVITLLATLLTIYISI